MPPTTKTGYNLQVKPLQKHVKASKNLCGSEPALFGCLGVMVWPDTYGEEDVEISYNTSDKTSVTKMSNILHKFLKRQYLFEGELFHINHS